MNEAIKINLSLTELGKVIYALVADKKQHIPYRDSKLTKLLMDSLGGNSKTVMIANIGPADYNYDETVTTLRYANRAKDIKNAPKINEDPKDAMIRQYQDELNKLKKMLADQSSGGLTSYQGSIPQDGIVSNESKQKVVEMEEKLKEEKELLLQQYEMEKKQIEDSKNTAEDEKLKLLDKLKLKQDEQEKHSKNREKLIQKLKMLEEKFVMGEEDEKKAKENEDIIMKTKFELEEKERKRSLLQLEIKKRNEENESMITNFDNIQSEIKEKTRIYEKLIEKLGELETEKDDINKDFDSELSQLSEYKKQLEKEISYKDLVKI
jgi:hypothetical protein